VIISAAVAAANPEVAAARARESPAHPRRGAGPAGRGARVCDCRHARQDDHHGARRLPPRARRPRPDDSRGLGDAELRASVRWPGSRSCRGRRVRPALPPPPTTRRDRHQRGGRPPGLLPRPRRDSRAFAAFAASLPTTAAVGLCGYRCARLASPARGRPTAGGGGRLAGRGGRERAWARLRGIGRWRARGGAFAAGRPPQRGECLAALAVPRTRRGAGEASAALADFRARGGASSASARRVA